MPTEKKTRSFCPCSRALNRSSKGLMYYKGCKLSNPFGIISLMQANRGWVFTGSRYAGKQNVW
jgi:hypothetical protein